MPISVEELSRKALLLEPAERVRLAEALLATVQEVDEETEAAWDAEIKRRFDEIESGALELVPAGEVFAELRALLK
jgi:putative addiction module component (TIGR02574 family)